MLENLFGSKTRIKLLSLFLKNSEESFFVRELTRKLDLQINAVRRELENLENISIIQIDHKAKDNTTSGVEKKYYTVNTESILYNELRNLFVKNQLSIRQNLLEQLTKLGDIEYLALTGIFIGDKTPMKPDMLLVGEVNRQTLSRLITKFEKELNHEINYTVMTPEEFKYRKDVTDKFLYEILEGKKTVVIDKIGK